MPIKPGTSFLRRNMQAFFDTTLFPLRAVFMGPKGYLGLSSLRQERMRMVARYCRGQVLDVGCGPHNSFIRDYIGEENGVGVDVYPYEGVDFIVEDPTRLPFDDGAFDTVTLIAVGGHIPRNKRIDEFREFGRVLRPGGRIVMTEGEPITQTICHVWWHFYLGLFGQKDIDHERGMEEEEQYCMPRQEIFKYGSTPPLNVVLHRRFMWRLNNIYIFEKAAG